MFMLFVLQGDQMKSFQHERERVGTGHSDPRKVLLLLAENLLALVTVITRAKMKLIYVNISYYIKLINITILLSLCLGSDCETFLLSDYTVCNYSLDKGYNLTQLILNFIQILILGSVDNEEPQDRTVTKGLLINPLLVSLSPEWKNIENNEVQMSRVLPGGLLFRLDQYFLQV